MLEIVNGSIPIAGRQTNWNAGTAGGVTQAAFYGHKAEQKRELAILEQEIGSGSFTIRSLVCTTLEDSISYCRRYFPLGAMAASLASLP